jgi:hypothetical protein
MNKVLVVILLCISLTTYADSLNSAQSVYKWNELIFKSDLQVNLHHFLHELARDEHYYRSIISSKNLTSQESQVLTQSVNLYKNEIGSGHILFNRGEIPQMTSSVLNRKSINFDTSISKAFLQFKPIYERIYWSKHHRQNKLWADELAPKIELYGEVIEKKLRYLFQSKLITKNVHLVDVVYKSGTKQGAYTSGRNSQTIINSTSKDYQTWFSLEMIYHEISHAVSLSRQSNLRKLISSVFKLNGLENEIGIWHPIQFYTVGEVVKETISKEVPNYMSYANFNGLYKGSWQYENIITKYWKPYIEGNVTMEIAINNIAKQLLMQQDNAIQVIKTGQKTVGFSLH